MHCVTRIMVTLGVTVGVGTRVLYAQHAGDIIVGRSATGQLKVETPDLSQVFPLGPVNGPFLFGCAGDEPGFDHLVTDEPGEDFFILNIGAEIRLECLNIEPAFKVWAGGLGSFIDAPGDRIQLGDHEIHEHVTWHIDSQESGFVPSQASWQAAFRLVDTGSTGYSESEAFTLSFQCAAQGACCVDDACEIEFADPCADEGGTYAGDGTACLGSFDGDTIDDLCDNCPDVSNQDQADSDGDETGDACDGCPDDPNKTSPGLCECGVVDANPCPGTLGACCNSDPSGGGCTESVSEQCACLTCTWSPSQTCNQVACARQAIPTMSEWGVLTLALALMVLAKVRFGTACRSALEREVGE